MAAALAATLYALGDLTMADVQAVRLGPQAFAAICAAAAPRPGPLPRRRALPRPPAGHRLPAHPALLHPALHLRRPTLVEQSRQPAELIAKIDDPDRRLPRQDARDAAFEAGTSSTWSSSTAASPSSASTSATRARWPLDAAYLSLEAPPSHGTSVPRPRRRRPRPPPSARRPAARRARRVSCCAARPAPARPPWSSGWPSPPPGRTAARLEQLIGRDPLRPAAADPDPPRRALPAPARLPRRRPQPAGRPPSPTAGRTGSWAPGAACCWSTASTRSPSANGSGPATGCADLIAAYPGNRWLVTSRPSAVAATDWLAAEDFTELALSPMSRDDVGRLHRPLARRGARRRAVRTTSAGARRPAACYAVAHQAGPGRLATNPLMCGLICALHRDRRGYLPHGRKELYDAALSMLLTRRDRERDAARPAASSWPRSRRSSCSSASPTG